MNVNLKAVQAAAEDLFQGSIDFSDFMELTKEQLEEYAEYGNYE
jgi:hypothetical protein